MFSKKADFLSQNFMQSFGEPSRNIDVKMPNHYSATAVAITLPEMSATNVFYTGIRWGFSKSMAFLNSGWRSAVQTMNYVRTHPLQVITAGVAAQSFIVNAFSLSKLNGKNGFNLMGVHEGDGIGSSVAAGDINGDGINDLVIGAPDVNNDAGVSYVIFGHVEPWETSLSLGSLNGVNGFSLTGMNAGDRSGVYIVAGDINGDGIDDLIIGAPYANNRAGVSYVIFGHVAPWEASVSLANLNGVNGFSVTGINSGDASGVSVAAGDVNRDGIDDLMIGAPYANNRAGASYVIFGHVAPWETSISLARLNGINGFSLMGINSGDQSGFYMVAAGDVNGDGIDDLMIVAPYANNRAGVSYVIFGHIAPWETSISLASLNGVNGFSLTGIGSGDRIGISVAAGDVNWDGLKDLIVGAPYANNGAGVTYVVFGHVTPWEASMSLATLNGVNGFSLMGINSGDASGSAVAAEDVNGDRIDDLIIGAANADDGVGATYVVFGSGFWKTSLCLDSLNGANGFNLTGINSGDQSGWSVAATGDVNGNGITDLIIGAPFANNRAGVSYVVFDSNLDSDTRRGGSNTPKIIAGVIAGSVLLAGITGGVYYYCRQKNKKLKTQFLSQVLLETSQESLNRSEAQRVLNEFLVGVERQRRVFMEAVSARVQPAELPAHIEKPQIFISYAWSNGDDSRFKNLQSFLRIIAQDSQRAGVSVWLDLQNMVGHIEEQMRAGIQSSHLILLMGTQIYGQKTHSEADTNVKKELEFSLAYVQESSECSLMPLLLEGDLKSIFPSLGLKYLIKDLRSWLDLDCNEPIVNRRGYIETLTGLEPLGWLPIALGFHRSDYPEQRKAFRDYYQRSQNLLMKELNEVYKQPRDYHEQSSSVSGHEMLLFSKPKPEDRLKQPTNILSFGEQPSTEHFNQFFKFQ